MTMKGGRRSQRSSNIAPPSSSSSSSSSPNPKMIRNASSPLPSYRRYLKPGALAKLRDSKIIATCHCSHRQYVSTTSLSQLIFLTGIASPSSSSFINNIEQQPPLNEDNGLPCFVSTRTNIVNHPLCLRRKKLFAVAPFFTETEIET